MSSKIVVGEACWVFWLFEHLSLNILYVGPDEKASGCAEGLGALESKPDVVICCRWRVDLCFFRPFLKKV